MQVLATLDREIIHFAERDIRISSKYRTIFYERGGQLRRIEMPADAAYKRPFGALRLTRRALRLDKCNVVLHEKNLVIIRQGKVYFYDFATDQLKETLTLRNCRNVLHQSINATPEGTLYFGEYGNNGDRREVPVYRSQDGGRSWEEIYTFPPGDIKHVHGCYYDRFTDSVWVCTGDFADENWLLRADRDFQQIERIGNGSQRYRTCNLIFTETHVHWLMDSQLEPPHHIALNRATGKTTVGQLMQGPIWYVKELTGQGGYLAASTQEIGPGVLDGYIHLYHSTDYWNWKTIHTFQHDGLPMRYFKFGVVGFADGEQSADEFYLFFEAVRGWDGRSVKCSL